MKKILTTILIALTSIVLLTGCSKADNYIGNADDETKTLIGETILNYKQSHPLESTMVLDKNETKVFDGETYIKIVSGYGYESFDSYKNLLNNTYSKNKIKDQLNFDSKDSLIKESDNFLYLNSNDAEFFKEIFGKTKVDLNSIDVITKSENALVISYKTYSSDLFFKEPFTDYLVLVNEGGKFLVEDVIDEYSIPDSEEILKISEHFNLGSENSNLILRGSGSSFNNVSKTFFKVYELKDNSLEIKYACALPQNPNLPIENLEIEDGQILNSYFKKLYPNNDNTKMLITAAENTESTNYSPKTEEQYVIYSSFNSGNGSSEYIVIPKYVDSGFIQLKNYKEKGFFQLDDFINGVSGDYTIFSNDSKEPAFEFKTEDLKNNIIPDGVKLVNYYDILNILEETL